MKPAVCVLCGKGLWEEPGPNHGDYLEFADYDPDHESFIGHPEGYEYYCDEHVIAARALLSKTAPEALNILRQQTGILEPREPAVLNPMPRWRMWIERWFGF